jgi:hypothetical protein
VQAFKVYPDFPPFKQLTYKIFGIAHESYYEFISKIRPYILAKLYWIKRHLHDYSNLAALQIVIGVF